MMAAIPTVLLLLGLAAIVGNAQAWDGHEWWNNGNGGIGGPGGGCENRCGENIGIGEPEGPGSWDNGVQAGYQDAVYDHDNNLAYNPYGQCYSCHSEIFWHGFHEGYDRQWNSYVKQTTNQGTSINIYGNGNTVNTNQESTQAAGSSLLRTIGQSLCSLARYGCNHDNNGVYGYGTGYNPTQESYP